MVKGHPRKRSLVETIFHELLGTGQRERPGWVVIVWTGAIFILGIAVWSLFLNLGGLSFDLHDWTQEGPRYDFLRRALLEGRLPLFMDTALSKTSRFLAIPDAVLSPQVLMLRFIEPGRFVLWNTLFLYSLGFVGLLLVWRRLGWSAYTFGVVSLLFSLCGYPMAHIAVGHSMWASYFLLPFFAYLAIELYESGGSWRWVGRMSLLQLGFFLQGGFHFVVWSLMYLLLYGLFNRRHLRWVMTGLIAATLLCMVRILPAAVTFSQRENAFISGYFSLVDLLRGFVDLVPPEVAREGIYSAVGWWEFDIYVGLLGSLFLIYFGVYRTLVDTRPDSWRGLAAPSLAMALLSMGKIFQPVNMLPLPLLNAERVSSRFIVLPFIIFLVLGGNQLDAALRERRFSAYGRLGLIGGMIFAVSDLTQHARLWRVERMDVLFQRTPVDIRTEVLSLTDPVYTGALLIGASLTFLCGLILILLWLRERSADNLESRGDQRSTSREAGER